MDDKNLNAGNQRYQELFDKNNQSANVEQQAANDYSRDYSSPSDHSAGSNQLRNLEQAATQGIDQTGDNAQRDISSQEDSAGFDSSSFDGSMRGANTKSGRGKRMSANFKRNAAIGGILAASIGGFMFTGFTSLSGPIQVIQAAEMLQDFFAAPFENIRAARAMRNLVDSVRVRKENAINKLSDRVRNTRVGKIATGMTGRTFQENLSKRGLSFDFSGKHAKLTMDMDGLSPREYDRLVERTGLNTGSAQRIHAIDIGSDNKIARVEIDVSRISRKQANAIIETLDDPTKSKVTNYFQRRMLLKKLGYVSWLHPFKRVEQAAYRKAKNAFELADVFIKEKVTKPIMKKVKSAKDFADKNDNKSDEETDEKMSLNKNEEPETGKWRQKIKNVKGATKEVTQKLLESTIGKLATKTLRGGNAVDMILDVLCTIRAINAQSGPFQMANVVNIAMMGTSLLEGTSSQIKSASMSAKNRKGKKISVGDITTDQAGAASLTMLGAEIPVSSDGKEITNPMKAEKEWSSFWQAGSVCATLGTKNCDKSNKNAPEALLDVKSSMLKKNLGNNSVTGTTQEMLNSKPVTDVCKVYDGVSGVFNASVGWVMRISQADRLISWTSSKIAQYIPNLGIVSTFTDFIIGILYGKSLDLSKATPRDWGYIATYGSVFNSNQVASSMGGKKQSKQKAAQAMLKNRRELAEQNSQKPILARLFDPTDYSSAINQIARAATINTSTSNPLTQLANVFRVTTQAPAILAGASTQIWGGTAYAEAASDYDYGVSTWGFDDNEAEKMSNSDYGSYELFKNIDDTTCVLANEEYRVATSHEENGVTIPGPGYDCNMPLDATLSNKGAEMIKSDMDKYKSFAPQHYYINTCLTYDLTSVADGAKLTIKDNQDGRVWNYFDMDGNGEPNKECNTPEYESEQTTKTRVYVMDYFNTSANACYYTTPEEEPETDEEKKAREDAEKNKSEDEKKSEQEYKSALDDECGKYGIGNSNSSSIPSPSSVTDDAQTILNAFREDTKAMGRQCGDYDGAAGRQCVDLSLWYAKKYHNLDSVLGNGIDIAPNLAKANSLPLKKGSDETPRAPSIFSGKQTATHKWHQTYGHTGVIIKVDSDGTIHTLETWDSDGNCGTEFTYKPEDYKTWDIVYLGDKQ